MVRGETRDESKTITVVEYTFQCVRLHGGAKIKAFMTEAFEWYTQEMAATEDNARYMWVVEKERKKKSVAASRLSHVFCSFVFPLHTYIPFRLSFASPASSHTVK